jgi:hypothetical protein
MEEQINAYTPYLEAVRDMAIRLGNQPASVPRYELVKDKPWLEVRAINP